MLPSLGYAALRRASCLSFRRCNASAVSSMAIHRQHVDSSPTSVNQSRLYISTLPSGKRSKRKIRRQQRALELDKDEEEIIKDNVLKEDFLALDIKFPKNVLNNAKSIMNFTQEYSYSHEGLQGAGIYCVTNTVTLPPPFVPPGDHLGHKAIQFLVDGHLQIKATGTAGSKKKAETLAAADCIAILYHHCGIDLRNPPTPPVLKEGTLKDDFLALDIQFPKTVLNNAKQIMKFSQEYSYSNEGSKGEGLLCATSTVILPAPVVPLDVMLQNHSNHQGISMLEDGSLQITTSGSARNKKKAEMLATADCVAILYHQCGIDLRDPPARPKQQEPTQADVEQFRQGVTQAQMMLELVHASRPKFDHEQVKEGKQNKWTAKASCFVQGQYLTATGGPSRKVKDAEGTALIAMVMSPAFSAVVGVDEMTQLLDLIEKSPAQHVAPLWIDPLPDELLSGLEAVIGSNEDYNQRMKQNQLAMEEHQRADSSMGDKSRKSHGKRRVRTKKQLDAINEALQKEENAKYERTIQNPDGKEAKMKHLRNGLPISKIRQDLLDALRSDHQVVVVSGGTGSGKSTQCPQYILEDAIANNKGAETQIVVTQPRRIAAISVAERVAQERHETIGNSSVGYAVRFKREAPRSFGSLEFVTTGVLLRRLLTDPTLEGVSHVMIDEVHERDINTDFLLILLRDLLVQRPDLRVVLMSATMDAESFGNYFAQGHANDVPVLSVPTQPRHPVEVIYLDEMGGDASGDMGFSRDLSSLANALLMHNDQQLNMQLEEAMEERQAAGELEALGRAEDEGELLQIDSDTDSDDTETTQMQNTRIEVLKRAVSMRGVNSKTKRPRVDKDFDASDAIVSLTVKLSQHLGRELVGGQRGSVLCFLPGFEEIKKAKAELEGTTELALKRKLKILPLHSSIPQEDQQKVFIPAEEGTVKIILATNIAESSVTISDVLAVVDSGLVRELNFDAESGMSTMETPLTSRSSATQRLGRAGRVAPGKCYRLYSRGVFEAMMPEGPTPEIQRTGLEATCLRTCNIPNQQVETFLARALDPPPKEAVSFAMQRLVKLGAIRSIQDNNRVLTPLGDLLSMLPLDPGISRMLIVGVTMQCLSPCLTAAACLSSRNVFNSPVGLRDEARETRRSLSASSDILAMVRAYDIFWELEKKNGWRHACDWAFENFVSVGAMTSIQAVRMQLLQELNRLGLVPNDDLERVRRTQNTLRSNAAVDRNCDIELLATSVWATAFPDNLAARRNLASFGTLRTRMNAHAGLHPSAVGFHRKPPKERGVTLPAWYSYREIVLSSQVFLRGCTALTPEQIVLFGGYPMKVAEGINLEFGDASNIRGVLDDWIAIEGSDEQTIDLLLNARHAINAAIEWKAMYPGRPLQQEFQDIVDAVCNLCEMLDESSPQSKSSPQTDVDSLVEDWAGRFSRRAR